MKKVTLNYTLPPLTFTCTTPDLSTFDDCKGQHLVLYFYPKDNTPGCTLESKDFRDHYATFQQLNTRIIGVSRDSLASHQKFIDKLKLPFPLISDADEKLCQTFDVLGEKTLFGLKVNGIIRTTFLIDKQGIVRTCWRKVKVKTHIQEVLNAVKAL